MKIDKEDHVKDERMYRVYLKMRLLKKLQELEKLIEKRIENNWKVKDAKELRRKSLEVRKELKKMKSIAVKLDKKKIKHINNIGKEK